jgi:large subunit ribosomal protein L7Ae
MGVPYAIVKGKARLGTVIHKKTATALAITEVRPEDKQALAAIVSSVTINFNQRFDEFRKQWGGGIMGFKSIKAAEKKRIATEKQIEARM